MCGWLARLGYRSCREETRENHGKTDASPGRFHLSDLTGAPRERNQLFVSRRRATCNNFFKPQMFSQMMRFLAHPQIGGSLIPSASQSRRQKVATEKREVA